MDEVFVPKKRNNRVVSKSANANKKRSGKRKRAADLSKNSNNIIEKLNNNNGRNKRNKPVNIINDEKKKNKKTVIKASKSSKNISELELKDDNISLNQTEQLNAGLERFVEPNKIVSGDNIKKKINYKKTFLVIILMVSLGLIIYIYEIKLQKYTNQYQKVLISLKEKKKISDIANHYDKIVSTINNADLFMSIDGNFVKKGTVSKNIQMELDETDINLETEFFKIKNKDYYIKYNDVLPHEPIKNVSNRYKRYIPFNENIVTKEHFTLYKDNKMIYSFDTSSEFPIIIKNYEGKYYVEYDNMFLSIKGEDVEKIVPASNTNLGNQKRVTTLAYHRIYKPGEGCSDPYVCMKQANFDREMQYLKENNYFTLTMEEFYMYLNGNLQVNNAVVLTFDDGLLMANAIETLEKYDLDGTVFVVTSVFYDYNYFKSKNVYVQSHSDDLHRNYVCKGGSQGGALLCENETKIKNDLKLSVEKTGNPPFAFAYPFYDYNDRAIRILKELGFKMAFAGRMSTNGRSSPYGVDLYKIPRMTVWELSIMPFNTWKSYL